MSLALLMLVADPAKSRAIAFVDDSPITIVAYEEYAKVLSSPDGQLRVSRDQVLMSLINQSIVTRYAEQHAIVVDRASIERTIASWIAEGTVDEALARGDGHAGLVARVEMFERFRLVKAAVVTPHEPSSETLHAAYVSDTTLSTLDPSEALSLLRKRLIDDQIAADWKQWLESQRACSDIRVIEPTFAIPSSTAQPGCAAR